MHNSIKQKKPIYCYAEGVKDTWPVEKLALAVISWMIVGHGSKSHTTQTLTGPVIDLKRAIIPGLGNGEL